MGRRGVRLEDQDRWVFNRLAAPYRARPGYPPDLVRRLAELAGGAGAEVADLGAGIGHLAVPLAAAGLRVAAVEPARAMLEELERRAGTARLDRAVPDRGTVRPVHAAAEATRLAAGAFDLVVLADAVQWVDPELAGREAGRLLAADGAVAVVEADFAPTPFMDGLRALLARANPRAAPRPPGAAAQVLGLAAPGRPVAVERFRQEAPLDPGALGDVIASLSYAGPAVGPQALAALRSAAAALAERTGGARFARDLTLRWAALRRRRRPRRPA